MEEKLIEDQTTAQTLVNTFVARMRSELIGNVTEWKDAIEAENKLEKDNNIWSAAFYAMDSWDATEAKIKVDIACKYITVLLMQLKNCSTLRVCPETARLLFIYFSSNWFWFLKWQFD